jgi:hypothetical protein
MNRKLVIKIIPALFLLILLISIISITNLKSFVLAANSDTTSSTMTAHTNKLLRSNWDMTVTDVRFHTGHFDPTKKAADVQMTFLGTAGLDKAFLPNGKITGAVGTSGKTYTLENQTIEQLYKGSEAARKAPAKGKVFYPGEFKLAYSFDVDIEEKNFSKIIYQDENKNTIEIPLEGITPQIVEANPDAK